MYFFHSFADVLLYACHLYLGVWRHCHNQRNVVALDLQQAFARIWRPVLEELQSIPLDETVVRHKESWVELGKLLGLSLEKRDLIEDKSRRMHETRQIRYKRCQWRDCFCSYHRPEHTMRVCKGCWRQRYCSMKCQKRYVSTVIAHKTKTCTGTYYHNSDWREGGHRENCRSRNDVDEFYLPHDTPSD